MVLKIVDGSIVHDNTNNDNKLSSSTPNPRLNTSSQFQYIRRSSITSLSDYKKNREINNSNNNIQNNFYNEIKNNNSNNNNNNNNINNNNNNNNENNQPKESHSLFRDFFSILIFKNPTMIQIIETLELSTKIYNVQLKLKYLLAICIASQIIFKSWGLLVTLLVFYLGTFYNKFTEKKQQNNNNNNNSNSYNIKISSPNPNSPTFREFNSINNSNNNKCKCKSPTNNSNYLSSSTSRVQTLSSSTSSLSCYNCQQKAPTNSLQSSLTNCSPLSSPPSLSSSSPNLSNYSKVEDDQFSNDEDDDLYYNEDDDQYYEEDEEDDDGTSSSSPAFHLYSSPNLRSACNKISTFSPNTGRKLGTN